MKLIITICATQNYCYAVRTLARRLAANLVAAKWTEAGTLILAGDKSRECESAAKECKDALPENWTVKRVVAGAETPGAINYKTDAQMLIAALRTAAFTEARRIGADLCWSLDSDTLPPHNALRCMLDMLRFDNGYYSISTCPYPNEAFLGGRGTVYNHIAQDVVEEERVLPPELKAEIDALKLEASSTTATAPSPEWMERKKKVDEQVRNCPPAGSIWALTDKFGWRRRGWLEQAYPAIGVGAVVPSDWCGFGCTLMTQEALALADFDGYDGGGTEDLFIVWRKWYPAKLRINVITHCPCDHVIWEKKKGGDAKTYTLIRSFHETEGECVGHLRTAKSPWKEF